MIALSSRDYRHLRAATIEASFSNHTKYALGAVLADGPRRLSAAANFVLHREFTHTSSSNHAETRALRLAFLQTRGATLYVVRVCRDGSWAVSKPCADCYVALRKAQVSRVVYINEQGEPEQYRVS